MSERDDLFLTPLEEPQPPPQARAGIFTRAGSLLLSLLGLPFRLLMNLLDIFFSALQRLVGIKGMAYVFILPNLLIFAIFILLPMLLNFYYGFTSGRSILLENRNFIGTANFEQLFDCGNPLRPITCREDLFWRAALNTVGFVVGEVSALLILSLVSALALNRKIVGRSFFRSVFFYPVLLSPVVVALIWKWILQHQYGVLNAVLVQMGIEKVPFLLDASWATFWVIFVSVWAQLGFYTLILLAGLQAIPGSLYEAASIDGAGAWGGFRFITFPLLTPTLLVAAVLAVIRAVQVFDQVFVLTGGGPGTATFYMVQYIYRTGFMQRQYGLASAASLVLAAVLLALTLGQLAVGRRGEEQP